MRHLKTITVLGVLAVLLAACADYKQYRTLTIHKGGETKVCDKKTAAKGTCAIEERSYIYGEKKPHKYLMSFVEFDDQGWFWDRKQMESLLRELYNRQDAKPNNEFLIFVFAHGWQHNANACDNNVICFQRLLERFDIMERELAKTPEKARTVVGVYVGWRGRSVTVPLIDNVTFWERKNTADRVGVGGVTELLNRLNSFRRYMNPDRESDKTQLIISGHSFGGQVIYSALAHSLIEKATKAKKGKKDGNGKKKRFELGVASSFGDLVVLVNPAFEGSRYEPLYHVATNRCYPENQRPAMMIITSKADDATGIAFPLGRSVSTLFETTQSKKSKPGQGDTILKTVGHLDRYRTHELTLNRSEEEKKKSKEERERRIQKSGKCGCPYLGKTKDFKFEDKLQIIKEVVEARKAWKEGEKIEEKDKNHTSFSEMGINNGEGPIEYGDDIVLTPNKKTLYAPNFPYLVIRTGENFIDSHNAIYSENFTKFLRRFFVRHVNARINFPKKCFPKVSPGSKGQPDPGCKVSDITKCVQSCEREDGSSCSSRSGKNG